MGMSYQEKMDTVRNYVQSIKGRRPSIEEVCQATGVKEDFIGLYRAINEGIQLSAVTSSSRAAKKEKKKIIDSAAIADARDTINILITENPSYLYLGMGKLAIDVQGFIGSPPPTKRVILDLIREAFIEFKGAIDIVQRRGRPTPDQEAKRALVNEMRTNVVKNCLKEYYKRDGKLPSTAQINERGQRVFGGKIPHGLLQSVRDAFVEEHQIESSLAPTPTVPRVKQKVKVPKMGEAQQKVMAVANLLGKQTDTSIARLAGVSKTTVQTVRKDLGIEAFVPGASEPEPPKSNVVVPPDHKDPVITAPTPPPEPVVVEEGDFEETPSAPEENYVWREGHWVRRSPEPKETRKIDQAQLIGDSIANLIRAGCKVTFNVQSPQSDAGNIEVSAGE